MDDRSRFEEISRLFDAVEGVPASERAGRLGELTDDAAMRDEVLGLFAHDSETAIAGVERLVRQSLRGTGDTPPRVAGFELGEVIGSGAMGVVYRAEQQNPRRSVAIKVIRGGPASSSMLRRFRSEADALARLRHPGIAAVYQTGVEQGAGGERPYLVMELVEGEPLNGWLKRVKPSPDERFALMQKVCDAVQHAHACGVVHRDLKPSNILVTADGEPKLIDFGVARITDPSGTLTMHTAAGEVVGTMAYMSPEQLSGDPSAVDTRSDVYALGVVLFYTLTGELPHDVTTMSLGGAARVIEESTARRVSAVDPGLRGDPETIIAKALEKDKSRRYQTVEALSDDIGRYRAHLPIKARPPSALYLAGRFARRNRALVGAACVVLAALVAASVVSTRSAYAARRALADSERAAERVRSINEFLIVDTLMAAHPQYLGVNAKISDAIEYSIPTIEKRFGGDPEGEAKVRTTVGIVLDTLGRAPESIEMLDRGMAALRGAGMGESRLAVEILFNKANVLVGMGKPADAEVVVRESLEMIEDLGLAVDDPHRSHSLGILGSALQSQGKGEEAEPILESVIDGYLAAGEPYPRELLPVYTFLYQAKYQLGKVDDMLDIADQVVLLSDRFTDPSAAATVASMDAWRNERRGNVEAGLAARRRGFEIIRATSDPMSYHYRNSAVNTAGSFAMNGRWEEAIGLLQHGIDVTLQSLGPYAWENERNAGYMAKMLRESGDPDGAKEWTRKRLTLRYFNAGPADDELESLESAYGQSAEVFGSTEAFVTHLMEQMAEVEDDAYPEFRRKFIANIGRILVRHDDPRGEALLRVVVELCDPAVAEHKTHEIIERARGDLPAYLERAGRVEDARAWSARLDALAAELTGGGAGDGGGDPAGDVD